MKQLLKRVLITATYRAAQDREEEQETEGLKSKLQTRLQALVVEEFENRRAELGSLIEECKATLQDAVKEASYDALTEFIGFTPSVKEDLNRIDRERISEAISVCHHLHKDKPTHVKTKISIKEILDIRAKSIPSGDRAPEPQVPASSRNEESALPASPPVRSPEALQAIDRIVGILAKICVRSSATPIRSRWKIFWIETGKVTRTSTRSPL